MPPDTLLQRDALAVLKQARRSIWQMARMYRERGLQLRFGGPGVEGSAWMFDGLRRRIASEALKIIASEKERAK